MYKSQKKERLLLCTLETDWYLQLRRAVFTGGMKCILKMGVRGFPKRR